MKKETQTGALHWNENKKIKKVEEMITKVDTQSWKCPYCNAPYATTDLQSLCRTYFKLKIEYTIDCIDCGNTYILMDFKS